MNFYETLIDKANRRHSILVLELPEPREDFGWTVEWDDDEGAFVSQVTKWFDPSPEGYGEVVTESGVGATRAQAAEKAMDAFLVALYAFNHARSLVTA